MAEQYYRNVEDPVEAVAVLRDLLADAEELIVLSAEFPLVEELADTLTAALESDVLVLLLVGGESLEAAREREYPATLARHWERPVDFVTAAVVDYHTGFFTMASLRDPESAEGRALRYRDRFFGDLQLNTMLSAWWQRCPELYAAEPTPLPVTHESFFYAIIDAARYLRADEPVAARIEGEATESGEPVTVEGEVINVRQSIISPATNSFPIEQSIYLSTRDGVRSVGSTSAQVEDVRAERAEFYRP